MADLRVLSLVMAMLLVGCGDDPGPGDAALSASETTYRRYCISCHASGAAGAPRLGDVEAWSSRSAAGWDTLMEHTVNGIRGMPARGLCRQCSDAELAEVVVWMLEQSGGLPPDAPAIVGETAAPPPASTDA